MNVEIINVGTELLLGEIVNTNATYIQKMCKELGFNVYYQTVVGDNHQRLLECLDIAFKRGANCVITTGGLGPTQDDLTKELSAQYLGLELIYDELEAKKVHDKCCFVTGLDEVPDNNYKQAYFPQDCFVLENEVGTANGCVMSKDEKMIINLPGPPKEMMYVVDHVLKDYLSQYKEDILYTYELLTMGIGESMVDEVLSDIIDHQSDVSIALYASEDNVRVRLGCKASSQQIANEMMQETIHQIEELLAPYIIKEKNLRDAVAHIMPTLILINDTDFDLLDGLEPINVDSEDAIIVKASITPHPLGEIIEVELKHQDDTKSFSIPLLKKASLSQTRVEAKLLSEIYTFLKSHQDK